MITITRAILLALLILQALPARAETPAQGASPPRSSADYIESMGGKIDYWHAERMPLRMLVLADPRVPGFKPQFKEYFLAACQSWADASKNKVSFKFVDNEPCDIKVVWTNDISRLLNSGELGQADWSNDQDGLFHADIKLLTVAENGRRAINDQEAKLMCLHELGHALGLVKHSPYLGDIMGASIDYKYNTPLSELVLSERDKNSISRLYAEGDEIIEQLSAASNDPKTKLMRLCLRAANLVRDGKYDAAYVLLDRALSIDPRCMQALNVMAECCFEQGMDFYASGNYAMAVSRLERYLLVCDALKSSATAAGTEEAGRTIARCKAALSKASGTSKP